MEIVNAGGKMEEKITLYPSNWLYNAGVVGFLRVLEFGGKNQIERILREESLSEKELDIVMNDAYWGFGLVYLFSQEEVIGKCLSELWRKFKEESKKGSKNLPAWIERNLNQYKNVNLLAELFKIKSCGEFQKYPFDKAAKEFYSKILENGKSTRKEEEIKKFKEYLKEKLDGNKLKELLKTIVKNKLGSKNSILAGHIIFNPGVKISKSEKRLRNLIKKVKEFIKNLSNSSSSVHCKICGNPFKSQKYDSSWDFFSRIYSSFMGTSYDEVPNFFFYYQHDIFICSLCQLLFIFSPFGLPPDQKEFVNVPSIKALFYLNNLLLKLKKTETYKTLNPNQRLESLISEALLNYEFLKGAWVLQNVEFIQLERGDQPKVYTLPVSRIYAELIIRGDVRRSLANLKGQITIIKKEKNPLKVYGQREGVKRFLTGGEGNLNELAYFSFKNDFMENKSNQVKETSFNLAKLEKIRIDYKKERRFDMVENDLIEIWNKGQNLQKEKFDKNLQYELLGASLIEDRSRLLEYISEVEIRNKLKGKLTPLKEFVKSKQNLNIREIILAFVAGYKSDRSLSYQDMMENPLKIFWSEGIELGKMERDIESRIKKYVFRIISRIRVGDRSGTIFEILKLYLLSEKQVPIYLSEIFRDTIDVEKFKLYGYSFIAGFIGKDEKETGDLMYEMGKIGSNVIEESLEDRIKKYGYRLLSLIRAGQRSEFAYEIIRLYAQSKKEIPYKFIEILDPAKSVAEFQSLAYGILSGYLEKQKT